MRTLLGDEALPFLSSFERAPLSGLRVNTPKCTPEGFKRLSPWTLEPVPWCPSGFLLNASEPRPGLYPLHRAGVYYLQEPSAMAVAEALAPEPGDWVIDLAAAPGGKSTHLSALMGGTGLLVANEVEPKRVRALGENLERWGAKNTVITSDSIGKLAQRWGAIFDRVLLDAPCSGEGMFRKSDEALAQWSKGLVTSCAARQDDLLAQAAELVRPGGVLVYSTCTFAPEENEAVVSAFLASTDEFVLEPLTFPGSQPGRPEWLAQPLLDITQTARLWPHRAPAEGHFIARLRRTEGLTLKRKKGDRASPSRQARDLWEAFVRETLNRTPVHGSSLSVQGDNLYALSEETPSLAGIRTLRPGFWLGTLKKNRLEPSHSLALALTSADLAGVRTLELPPGSPDLTRYLRGDVLEAPGDEGWLVITIAGFALGWGRRSQGVVKNFYPKGLRLSP